MSKKVMKKRMDGKGKKCYGGRSRVLFRLFLVNHVPKSANVRTTYPISIPGLYINLCEVVGAIDR